MRWTRRLQRALAEVRASEARHQPGDPSLPVEVAKVALANAFLAAIAQTERVERLRPTPARASLRRRKQKKLA